MSAHANIWYVTACNYMQVIQQKILDLIVVTHSLSKYHIIITHT